MRRILLLFLLTVALVGAAPAQGTVARVGAAGHARVDGRLRAAGVRHGLVLLEIAELTGTSGLKRRRKNLVCLRAEKNKNCGLQLVIGVQMHDHLADGDLRRLLQRISIHSRADGGKTDRPNAALFRHLQDSKVARLCHSCFCISLFI